jgi:hypothetical protein
MTEPHNQIKLQKGWGQFPKKLSNKMIQRGKTQSLPTRQGFTVLALYGPTKRLGSGFNIFKGKGRGGVSALN